MNEDALKFLSYGEGRIKSGGLYPERKGGHCELLWLRRGCLYICEGYREYRMTDGDVLIADGSASHYGFRESSVDSDFIRVVFGGNLVRSSIVSQSLMSQHRLFLPAHPERFEALIDMIKLYYSLPEYPDESLNYLLRIAITELYVDGIPQRDVNLDRIELCGQICDYIRERNGVVKASELASHFGYTQKYLSAIFSSRYSRGLKSYIDAVRLAYLKLSLTSDISMIEAAHAAGFSELKPMQDFFRYNTGVTLADWLNER